MEKRPCLIRCDVAVLESGSFSMLNFKRVFLETSIFESGDSGTRSDDRTHPVEILTVPFNIVEIFL